jgi:hypothetical protein
MAIIRTGTVTGTGSAINLNLGFVPSQIRLVNHTTLVPGTGIVYSEWYNSMANASAYQTTVSSSAPVISYLTTNGFTPYQTADSALWTPTRLTITGISKAAQAVVTATHAFTSADYGVTVVTFSAVVGMIQINGLRGTVVSSTSTTSFTVNIDTTGFTTYSSGGEANIITGIPATTLYGNTILTTAQANVGQIGITLGTSVAGSSADVIRYVAVLDTDVTSA